MRPSDLINAPATRCSAFRIASLCACVVLLTSLAGQAQTETFSFAALNRNYTNLVDELEPILVGPATVVVRSPEHLLRLVTHSAVLTKSEVLNESGAGGVQAVLTIEIEGAGRIEADVRMTGIETTIHDALVVPRQTLEVRGRLSVAKDEEGYLVRALELQPSVFVRIESELASRLFKICRPMGLVLVALDCGEMERSLTNLEVPLPVDQVFYLAFAELSAEEKAALDRFLDQL